MAENKGQKVTKGGKAKASPAVEDSPTPKAITVDNTPEEPKKKMGRPKGSGLYTQALGESICKRVALGEALITICKDDNMPCMDQVLHWANIDPTFADMYTRARDTQADTLADGLETLAASAIGMDAAGVQAIRLQVDTRKWIVSKLKPRRYGEHLQIDGEIKHRSADSIEGEFHRLLVEFGVAKALGAPEGEGDSVPLGSAETSPAEQDRGLLPGDGSATP